jgi:dienelactone hydrolase
MERKGDQGMSFGATGIAIRAGAALVVLAAIAACTTHVPLSDTYRGPDAWPDNASFPYEELHALPFEVAGDVEARSRANFVVRQVSLPATADSEEAVEFEYYDVDGDARTPVVVLLPVFTGHLKIPRFFARYFANQGWAAVVVTRGRDPLDALTAPEETVRSNLESYSRVLDWAEREPDVDPTRIGVLGVSLGAMDAVMLTALDRRVNSLVIAMAGGDLSYLLANTNYRPVVRTMDDMASELGMSREALGEDLDAAIKLDPLAVAPYIDAERVFMVLTRTDAIIPFEAQEELRATMGSPEAMYLLTGHRLSVVFFPKVRNAAFEFFARRFAEHQVALALN